MDMNRTNKKVKLFVGYHKKYVWSLTKSFFSHQIKIVKKNGEYFIFYAVELRSANSLVFADLQPILDLLTSATLEFWESTLVLPVVLSNECQKKLEMKMRHLRMISFWLENEEILKIIGPCCLTYRWLKLFSLFFANRFVRLSELRQEYGVSLENDLRKISSFVTLVHWKDNLYLVRVLDEKWIKKAGFLNKFLTPYYPMVAKPRDWKPSDNLLENFTGGYHMNSKLKLYSLQPRCIGARLIVPSVQGAIWWKGINKLQSNGFRLDWDYVSFIKETGLANRMHIAMFETLSSYMFPNDMVYFPLFVDGRGRIYTRSPFGYTFSKLVRWSLSPLESSRSYDFLEASCVYLLGGSRWYGWKRSSVLELKQKFTDLVQPWFLGISKSPPTYLGRNYKLIRYYLEWKRRNKGLYSSSFFIEIDMTASVIQMIFLLLREADQYCYVNLEKSSEEDRIASYYMYVWLIYKKRWGKRVRQTDKEGLSFIKRTLIACSYGLNKKNFLGKGYRNRWSRHELECLWEVYYSLPGWGRWRRFFDFLGGRVQNKLEWTTPLGTRVEMNYLDIESQRRALSANLLHSLDSSLVVLFCSRMHESGVSFFWVHDALYIQSGLEKEVKLLFYQCLYDLFKDLTLESFWGKWKKNLMESDLFIFEDLTKNSKKFDLRCSFTNFTIS